MTAENIPTNKDSAVEPKETRKIKKSMTLEDAKKEIYRLILQNANYREIAKKEFLINGQIRKFSISQLSKIKKEFEPETNLQNKDPDKALLFKLFKQGKFPTQVLIETGFAFEYIKQAYQDFLEFEEKTTVPKSFVITLINLEGRISGENCNYESKDLHLENGDYEAIEECMEEAIEALLKLEKFTYPCSVCSRPLYLNETVWPYVKEFLTKSGWHHGSCKAA